MKSRWLGLPLVILGIGGNRAGEAGGLPTQVDRFLAQQVAARHFSCGALAIVVDGTLAFERGYGACGAAQIPADPAKSLFRAASTSKVFAAVAALQLVERNALRLDAGLGEYFPDVPITNPSLTPLTTAHLLTHTSGIEPRMLGTLALTPARRATLADFFRQRGVRLTREPGRLVAYSNLGIALAGLVVERVSKTAYDRYVEEQIFAPLGMTSSSFRQPLPPELDARLLESRRGAPFIIPYPAGSLAGTAHDMGLFLGALANEGGPILSPASTRLLLAPHWRAHPDAPGVAYGFFEAFHNGARVLEHTGDGGHHSLLLVVPESRFGLYFVAETGDQQAIELRRGLARVALDALAPPPSGAAAETSAPAKSDLSVYLGLWRGADRVESNIEKVFSLPMQARVALESDGALRITSFGGGISERLTPLEEDLFRGSDDGYYAFGRNPAGRPETLTISGEGTDPLTFRRAGPLEDARLHLGIVVLFGLAVLSVPLGGASRWFRKPSGAPVPAAAKRAGRILTLVAATAFAGPVVVFAGFFVNRPPYDRVPGQVVAGIALLHFLVLLLAALAYCAVRAWREGWWRRAYRTYYSVVAASGLAFAAFLLYWNLLGFRF